MSEVVQLLSPSAVDAAWESFRAHAQRSFDDRRLILDRGYMTEWARLEGRFKRLANMSDKH